MKHTCHGKGCLNSHISTQCSPLWWQHRHVFSQTNSHKDVKCHPVVDCRKYLAHVVAVQPFERGRIVGQQEAGWTYPRIAAHIEHNVSVMCCYFQQWSVEHSHTYRLISGCPRSTDACPDRQTLRTAVALPREEIQAHVAPAVSPRIIANHVLAAGLRSRVPVARLPIKLWHCQAQLLCCHERVDWRVEWHCVVFSDESRFCLYVNDERTCVRHRPGECHLPECICPRHAGLTSGFMVWGGGHQLQLAVTFGVSAG